MLFVPKTDSTWIVDFLLHEGEKTTCKCIVAKGASINEAIASASVMLEKEYQGRYYFIHNVGMADLICREAGEIFTDPIGWDDEELEKWKWM